MNNNSEYRLLKKNVITRVCKMYFLMSLQRPHLPYTGCLRKKYDVADYQYQYFNNGNTQQCNIFSHKKYNFRLLVCAISTPYVKRDESYELHKNDG